MPGIDPSWEHSGAALQLRGNIVSTGSGKLLSRCRHRSQVSQCWIGIERECSEIKAGKTIFLVVFIKKEKLFTVLQGHGGKHACLYCEGLCDLDCTAPLWSLGSLDSWHKKFLALGGKERNTQLFKNCVHSAILKVCHSIARLPAQTAFVLLCGLWFVSMLLT